MTLKEMRPIHFGDVFYITPLKEVQLDNKLGRPAVIVSNDINNRGAATVNVIYISSKEPTQITHVYVSGQEGLRDGIFQAENVTTVSRSRIGDYITSLDELTMSRILQALKIQLNMEVSPAEKRCQVRSTLWDLKTQKV